jgi:hypothetical protein
MHMINSLACVFAILNSHIILNVIDSLQLFSYLLGSHEQVQCLDLGQVLEFRDYSAGTDHDMTVDKGTIVYKAEYIFAH